METILGMKAKWLLDGNMALGEMEFWRRSQNSGLFLEGTGKGNRGE
jgi:hypothetical protein